MKDRPVLGIMYPRPGGEMGMDVKTKGDGITFAVHEVEAVRTPLQTWKTEHGINQILLEAESGQSNPIQSCSGYNSNCVRGVNANALITAVHIAFSEHRPLVLSPDMMWIAILQGFAQHVKNHAEELRSLLVKHAGKKKIIVLRNDIFPGTPENDWEGVIADFSRALDSEVGATYSNLVSDFSTTGVLERTVCQVALMDTFQPYFHYELMCICGIPEITLEGVPADWLKLRQKIELLAPYKMDWWLPHLRTIAEQFHRASQGDIDAEFWRNIYKQRQGYGFARINGWMAKLVPYLKCFQTGDFVIRNPLLEPDADQWLTEPTKDDFFGGSGGITTNQMPSGLSMVPFTMTCIDSSQEMQFLGGFVGVEQKDTDLAVRPKLGWAVRKAPDSPETHLPAGVKKIEPLSSEEIKQTLDKLSGSLKQFGASIPGELVAFFKSCNGVMFADGRKPFRSIADLEFVNGIHLTNGPVVPWVSMEEQRSISEDHSALEFSALESTLEWIRYFDNPDGSFYAIELWEHEPGKNRVCHVMPNKNATVIAFSFNEFLQLIFAGLS